ncbi:cysteine dioxygenase [Paenibacillus rigui]|uniref:Cysteine dioxygenase n=1 Tax=Paenibacillus rigui TaxID=554312 RepID=A0A229UVI1_9BACL|nr:cysteine dioxygenase family protein [Paenibacillus rigui]OXM87281.1 cysteine dioxygenase [Paenibacillus rigui]
MKLLESIEQAFRNVKQPNPHELRGIIGGLGLTSDLLAPWIEEPGLLPYGRKVMYQSANVEVIVVHLPQGTETFIHDHGASVGCAFVLEGALTNRIYRLGREGYAYEEAAHVIEPGKFLYAPRGQIHQMSNAGPGRLVSFHVYAPKLSETKMFYTYEQVLDYVI